MHRHGVILSKQIDELEETLRLAQTRSTISDDELNNVKDRISTLLHKIQHSLNNEVYKLTKVKNSMESSQRISVLSQYMTPHLGRPSLMESDYSSSTNEPSVRIGESISTTSTMTIPNASTLSNICEWLNEWETGKSSTQQSVSRLSELLDTLQTERSERLTAIMDDDDDTISTNSSNFSSNETDLLDETELEEYNDFKRLPSTFQVTSTRETKTPQEELDVTDDERSMLQTSRVFNMSPSLARIVNSIDLFISGILNTLTRAVRLLKNVVIESVEIPTLLEYKMLKDPLFIDDVFDDEISDDFYYPTDFDARFCHFDPAYGNKHALLPHGILNFN
jgi:hypothetical protein